MTPADAVARARLAIGHRCLYFLGHGGFDPLRSFPWHNDPAIDGCDCSGFVAWCLGLSRRIVAGPLAARYKPYFGEWLETSAIVRDAKSPFGLFTAVPWEEARSGDLLVYGDADGHQGHVGIVASADHHGPLTVVHCSSGNFKGTGDAVQETGPHIWQARGTVARYADFVEVASAGSDTPTS